MGEELGWGTSFRPRAHANGPSVPPPLRTKTEGPGTAGPLAVHASGSRLNRCYFM